MTQQLPKILPVNELKNTANIMKICQESEVPIVIKKWIWRSSYDECKII